MKPSFLLIDILAYNSQPQDRAKMLKGKVKPERAGIAAIKTCAVTNFVILVHQQLCTDR